VSEQPFCRAKVTGSRLRLHLVGGCLEEPFAAFEGFISVFVCVSVIIGSVEEPLRYTLRTAKIYSPNR